MRLRRLLVFLIAGVVLAADRVTKYLVASNLELNQPWYPFSFLKPVFALTYIRNTGAAFGIFQNQNLFFTIVAIVVIIGIFAYLRSSPEPDLGLVLSLGLLLGGAFGNLIDRVLHGYVVDFIHLSFWAISNVADVCITLGILLLTYNLLFRSQTVATQAHVPVPQESLSSPLSENNTKTDTP